LAVMVSVYRTPYRNMAQDCVDQAPTLGDLSEVACITKTLHVHGYHINASVFGALSFYGTNAVAIRALIAEHPKLGEQLDAAPPYVAAEVVWAAREEMDRSVEDDLARRTRALFLTAKAALRMARAWQSFWRGNWGGTPRGRHSRWRHLRKSARGFQVASRKIA